MEKNRENFMENAGDLFYEVKENEKTTSKKCSTNRKCK